MSCCAYFQLVSLNKKSSSSSSRRSRKNFSFRVFTINGTLFVYRTLQCRCFLQIFCYTVPSSTAFFHFFSLSQLVCSHFAYHLLHKVYSISIRVPNKKIIFWLNFTLVCEHNVISFSPQCFNSVNVYIRSTMVCVVVA